MLKNVFIDAGTSECQGLNHFVNFLSIDKNWEIHAFEPNPLLQTNDCIKKMNLNIVFHKKAVWIKNGFSVFKQYGNDGKSQGGLLEETKGDEVYGGDFFSSLSVETIDFYSFLNSFDKSQNIYMKMDIECAEYEVLEHLLLNGWPKNIKHIWVEWHRRYEDFYINRSKKIIEKIKNNGCEVTNWI